MRKNVAGQSIAFQLNALDGQPGVGLVPVVMVTKDGSDPVEGGGMITELGGGQYLYEPLQSETNGYHLTFQMAHASVVDQLLNIYTVLVPADGGAGTETSSYHTNITLTRGDDVLIRWPPMDDWPDISEGTIKLGMSGITGNFEKAGSVDPDGFVKVNLTAAESAALQGWYRYDIQHTDPSDGVSTLVRGRIGMKETDTDVPVNPPSPVGWPG